MNNFWQNYPGNPNYQIYQNGDVKHISKDVKKIPQIDRYGYLVVNIYDGKNGYKTKKIHRLVAETFIPNPKKKPHVNHIDGDKTNNWYWNLEWVTSKENTDHAFKNGLQNMDHLTNTHSKGENNPKAKLTNFDVRMILKKLQEGFTTKQVAIQFGVSQSTIQRINSGKLWKHLQ